MIFDETLGNWDIGLLNFNWNQECHLTWIGFLSYTAMQGKRSRKTGQIGCIGVTA